MRKLVAENRHLPIENLRLILRGNVLHDSRDEDDIRLNNGGTCLFFSVRITIHILLVPVIVAVL